MQEVNTNHTAFTSFLFKCPYIDIDSHGFPLIPKSGERHDMDSVRPRIGDRTGRDNHKDVRFAQTYLFFPFIILSDKFFNFKQMHGSFFNPIAAKFKLNKSISAIRQMQYAVSLKIISVMVV